MPARLTRAKLMSVFIYVQAKFSLSAEIFSFQHRIVIAKDEEDAYLRGQRLTDSTKFVLGLKDGELINDYAIEVDSSVIEVANGGKQ
jgi:hypothetical protein